MNVQPENYLVSATMGNIVMVQKREWEVSWECLSSLNSDSTEVSTGLAEEKQEKT